MLNKENLSKIGDRIKKVRQQKKLTQPELGEKIQMDKSAISKIETSGRIPSLEQLVDIAAALDVRVEYLLGIDNVVDEIYGNHKIPYQFIYSNYYNKRIYY